MSGDDQSRPRIRPLQRSEWTEEIIDGMGVLAERNPLPNIYATLARHPALFRRFRSLASYVLDKSTLPPRATELAVLRVGWLNHCPYEFAQHAVIALRKGLTEEEVGRVPLGPGAPGWGDLDRLVLRCADELVTSHRLSDECWSGLNRFFDTPQVMDLVFTVGCYSMLAWALNSFGVQVDDYLDPDPFSRYGGGPEGGDGG